MDEGLANATLCRGSGLYLEPGAGDDIWWKCEEGNPGEMADNPRGWCVPATNRCNGFENCLGDGSDELDCYTEDGLRALDPVELLELATKVAKGKADVSAMDTDVRTQAVPSAVWFSGIALTDCVWFEALIELVLDGAASEDGPDTLVNTRTDLDDDIQGCSIVAEGLRGCRRARLSCSLTTSGSRR